MELTSTPLTIIFIAAEVICCEECNSDKSNLVKAHFTGYIISGFARVWEENEKKDFDEISSFLLRLSVVRSTCICFDFRSVDSVYYIHAKLATNKTTVTFSRGFDDLWP